MIKSTIVGRLAEQEALEEIFDSNEAQFLAIYGRRRIGKTFLISEFFKDKGLYFEITGVKDQKKSEQLFHFAFELSRKFNHGKPVTQPKTWVEAFHMLVEYFDLVDEEKKIILFFDEAPWLASKKSGFLQALEHFWNRYASRKSNVILIICGSIASWIIKNIIKNKGGLHGRITKRIQLRPFTLSETEDFLKSRSIELDRKQVVDIYMCFGGVPKYLSYIKRGVSAVQTINKECFSSRGEMYDEFDNLYKSLFNNCEKHVEIIRLLSKINSGMTKKELLKKIKMTSGGSSSKIIQELIDSGFITYIIPFGEKQNGGKYRLIDEFSLFHLTWIKGKFNQQTEYSDQDFWIKTYGTQRWSAWSGIAFESVCMKHLFNIKRALGISGINCSESGWWFTPKNHEDGDGAQIDLVIDRADRCINIIEMKYSDHEFVIDKAYALNLKKKKVIFKENTKTTKSLFMTLITTYGTVKNSHYLGIIDNQLTIDDLF